MKTLQIALVLVCSLGVGIGAAKAQSNVSIYGLLDAGVTKVTNLGGGTQTRANGGGFFGERLGFRGTEDLGGGLSAFFSLEMGLVSSTGALAQGGLGFGRQSFVGLKSAQYGSLSAGRQYDSMAGLAQFSSGYMYNGFYTIHMANIDRSGGDRINNSIKYESPEFAGLSFDALYGFGEQIDSTKSSSSASLGVRYKSGNFRIGLTALSMRDQTYDLTSMFGLKSLRGAPLALTVGGTSTTTPFKANYSTIGLGAGYQLGDATITGILSETKLKDTVSPRRAIGDISVKVAEIGVNYFVTPIFTVGGDYTLTKLDENKWHTFGGAVHYYLSKRTDLYFVTAHQRASGDTNVANIFTVGNSSSQRQTVYRVGMRHVF